MRFSTKDMDKENRTVALTNFGARRALNYITDIAKGRKRVVTFIMVDDKLIEANTGKEIEVECREKRGGN